MFDVERFDMRMAIGGSCTPDGKRDFDLLIGSNLWLRRSNYINETIYFGTAKDQAGMNMITAEILANFKENEANNLVSQAVVQSPNNLTVPGYFEYYPTQVYAVDNNDLVEPSNGPADFNFVLVNEQTPDMQEELLEEHFWIMADGFDIALEQRPDYLKANLRDPNTLLYLALDQNYEGVATATVVNDGIHRSLWAVSTIKDFHGQGYGRCLAYSALKDSEQAFGKTPIYLATRHDNPTVYTSIGFEKVRTLNAWAKYLREPNDQI